VSLFLSKLLPIFLYPLGAGILFGFLALLLLTIGFRKSAGVLLAVVLAGLWLTSTPVFANWLTLQLEDRYARLPFESLPTSDAIILLGGVLSETTTADSGFNAGDAVDRVLDASRAFHARKAPRIVISAGNLPWEASGRAEAALIADFLVELAVPRSSLILEGESRNTHQNAVNTAALFKEHGWRRGLLITSAIHMPRAAAAFESAGVEVDPMPSDFQSGLPLFETLLDFLPDAGALAATSLAMKEIIGLRYYQYRGWAGLKGPRRLAFA
jgi:uncharacterized SAM-binding protein YcdF (DUF218 family)